MRPTILFSLLFWSLFSLTIAEETAPETLLLNPVDESRNRTIPIKVYFAKRESPVPVVLFSHGLGGSREANPYLGTHWVKAGYLAVFIQHPGSDVSVWKDLPLTERMGALKEAANFRSSLHRYRDVPFVIDQLERWNAEEGHPLFGKLNLDKIGMSGHSYGARTTQVMMGEKFRVETKFADERISAFLPFSPSISKQLTPEESFGHISAPVLLMTGTKDGSPIDPSKKPEDRMKVFTGLPDGDKYQLVLKDAEHFAFGSSTDGFRDNKRFPHHHPAIQKISTLFWDAYLKDDAEAKKLLQSESLRDAAGLVTEDRWEWK